MSATYPALLQYPITATFGQVGPWWRRYGAHTGLDLAMPEGTVVGSLDAGTVSRAEWTGEFGNLVSVQHWWGRTDYAHLSEISVQVGQMIGEGEALGRSGSTGLVTGPTLHIEAHPDGVPEDNGYGGAVDPLPYLEGWRPGGGPLFPPWPVRPEHLFWGVAVGLGIILVARRQ